ncbi:MAG: hypothetical protein KAG18_02155, partial [Sinobacterium sp.]|nr:hypothetical protein [Sinobacterium sp.]
MMNLKKIIILCGLAAIFFLAIAYMAGLFTDKIEPGEVAVHYQGSMDDGIPAVLKTVQLSEPFPASVEAKQATIISSRILSRIEKVHVRAG